jgi:hypothetical protein
MRLWIGWKLRFEGKRVDGADSLVAGMVEVTTPPNAGLSTHRSQICTRVANIHMAAPPRI